MQSEHVKIFHVFPALLIEDEMLNKNNWKANKLPANFQRYNIYLVYIYINIYMLDISFHYQFIFSDNGNIHIYTYIHIHTHTYLYILGAIC